MLKTLTALAAGLALAAPAAADLADSNGNLWLNYVGDHPLFGTPWGLHLEVQNRREELGREWQQLLIRPGLNYQISPTVAVSAGWAYVRTYPYGDFPADTEFPEHRAWEQVTHRFEALGLEWQQRLRLEQRWIGEMAGSERAGYDLENWRYENRVRYLLRTTLPLTENKKTYLALWNETFVNFGSNVSGNVFDQNRAFVGLGRKLGEFTRLEIGFMEQTVQRRGGEIWEHNHTPSIWLTSVWPFGRR